MRPDEIEASEVNHVYPVGDIYEHDLSPYCRCRPRVELGDGGALLFIHRAWDRREDDEQAATTSRLSHRSH